MCKLYSFWPELSMKITNKDSNRDTTKDTNKKTNTNNCSIKLTWSSFSKIHKVISEPSLFFPNINNI